MRIEKGLVAVKRPLMAELFGVGLIIECGLNKIITVR